MSDINNMDDLDIEPIPGLPDKLPEGEKILWQGKPDWWGIALRVFHLRKIAVYFAILVAWQGISAYYDGAGLLAAMGAMINILPIALFGLAVLAVLARSYSKTTIFTITNKRVVIRFGIALPIAVNFPFCKVDGVSLRQCADGTGDLAIEMQGPDKIAYLHLWPFARPGKYRLPQPMLRALPDAKTVASILGEAVKEETGGVSLQASENAKQATQPVRVDPGMAVAAR